jgi:hypothetical protein
LAPTFVPKYRIGAMKSTRSAMVSLSVLNGMLPEIMSPGQATDGSGPAPVPQRASGLVPSKASAMSV